MTMKAIRIETTGGSEVLDLVSVDTPTPNQGEVLIRHAACGVNFIDIYQRTGLYPIPLPSGLGLEASGEIVAVGSGVDGFQVGDRVAYCTGPIGAYAEAAVVPAYRVVRLPESIGFDVAAGLMLKGLTAEFLVLRCTSPNPGDTVLFHAAAGGVGLIACAWLAHRGVRVIGTAGSEEKAALALQHGCSEVILYRQEDVATRVRALTNGEGVAVVYDSVGADTLAGSLASLKRRGTLVSFGNASGPPPPVPPADLSRHGSLYLTRPTLFDYVSTTAELRAAANSLFDLVEKGIIVPNIGSRRPLYEAAAAQDALAARETTGSTILIP
jgi:NADPH:quinone reductase